MTTLGNIIKTYRTKKKMPIRDFAKLSGLSPAYVCCLEKGVHPKTGQPIIPSFETVCKAATALETELFELMQKIGIEVDKELAQENGLVPPPSLSAGAENLRPWGYIPLNKENLGEAIKDGRLLILPFKAPRVGMVVVVPSRKYDMCIRYVIDSAQGGVYTAMHPELGKIRFTLFDMEKVVFTDLEKAHKALADMRLQDCISAPQKKDVLKKYNRPSENGGIIE